MSSDVEAKARATLVPITYPAQRCAAPGCGDKIKGLDEDDMMWRIELSYGVVYAHRWCAREDGTMIPQEP